MIESRQVSQPNHADVQTLREMALAGRPLDAFAYAFRFGPFEAWTDPRARRAASWLCETLGAPKRARTLELDVYRRFPRSAVGRLVRLHLVLAKRGPVEAWRALRAEADLGEDATDEDRAELLLFEGHILSKFRDFDRATATIRLAGERGASLRRVTLFQAQILMERDRYGEALAMALEARRVTPDSPDVMGFTALLHLLVGEADEALAILRSGAARTQSASIVLQLADMLEEHKLLEERAEWIERWAERVPLLERREQLTQLRADSAFERGDLRTALALLRTDPSPMSARLAERLSRTIDDPGAKRVLLDVPFVRQHHMTCAPATLTALAGYWRMPADHLEVAEAICYDGTPGHSQRTWAEEHGFVVREMTVTWDVARALLDRGVPFTVAIVDGVSAHLQAIVGYDERRGTLVLRDPFIPKRIEALAEEWLEAWRATGPHGMVILPAGEETRIDGIDLPDAPLYEELHRLNAALGKHDRDGARKACDALTTSAPAHRLAIAARRALAAYDQDAEGVLACARESAAMFPAFVAAKLDALACMRTVRSRDERVAMAAELVRAHPQEPLYAEALAVTLADDARQHPVAARLLRRVQSARPDRHGPLALVANIAWDGRRFDEALALRRFAACLGRFDEAAALSYFSTASALGREEEATALLEARAGELGGLAAGPVETLFRALESRGRTDEGLAVVRDALERRKNDGDLLLLSAEIHGAIGDIDEARALLARAQGAAKTTAWLRGAARLALRAGAFAERKELLERLLELEPLDVGAHVSYASAIAATEGTPSARSYLERAWTRTPHLRSLSHVYLEWLRGAGAAVVERAARKVLALDPNDDWTHRELAIALVDQGRIEEAHASLEVAAAVAPTDASLECTRAVLFRREGKREEARRALLTALDLDPDRGDAIADLVATAEGAEDREQTLRAVEAIVHPRSVTGAGILAWYAAARTIREPRLVAEALDRLRAERPDHPAGWSTSIGHRSLMGDHDAALALADEACARFPLGGAIWRARADALLSARRSADALAAIERAVRVDSLSVAAVSRLANAYLRAGDAARARDLLARAIGRLPGSTALRGQLAELAWGMGDRARALTEIEGVLALESDHVEAWKLLDDWSAGEPGEAGAEKGTGALARIEAVCAERPWSAHAALNLARTKARHDDIDGALATLDRATALDPRLQDARDFRVVLLAFRGRFDDAVAACSPPAFASRVPRELEGRAAWVRARRGDLDGACEAMRKLLAEHVDYAWGWGELARWQRQRGAPQELLVAANHLVATSPNVSGYHRLLAGALFEVGDRAGAKRALERAVDLAPNDLETLAALFDVALDDDLAAADRLVPLLRAANPAAALSGEARLCARRNEEDRAMEALRSLAVHARADAALVAEAYRACVFAGLADRCYALVVDLLEDEATHASIGELWVRARVGDDDVAGVVKAMRFLDPKRAAVRAAACLWLALLKERGEQNEGLEAARLVRQRFAPCDDRLWGAVAGLLVRGAPAECVSWTNDWRARPNATSAMLFGVASSLREVGREDEAYEVVQRAARLPTDAASQSHRTWLAFNLAVLGDAASARTWLSSAGNVASIPIVGAVATLTNAALVAPERGRGVASFGEARALLRSARAECRYTVVLRAHERATKRVAGDAGLLGTMWLHRSALAVVGVLAGVALALFAFATGVPGTAEGAASISAPSFSPGVIVGLLIFGIRAAMRQGRRS